MLPSCRRPLGLCYTDAIFANAKARGPMPLPIKRSLLAATALLALALAGCADKEETYVERPATDLYDEASAALKAQRYKEAAKLFDEVERQHPYSQYAAKSELMAAYSSYQDMKYDDAILAYDRFTQLHPGAPEAAYAYYMRALCYYEQITDVRRDQKITKQAMDSLLEVMHRFPDTEYARDAKLKVDMTNDHLAGKEMEIGRFYQLRGQSMAALGRYRTVIEQYQTTSHVPEALHRLVECYLQLGIPDEAQTAGAVLGHNFPGSDWYQDSYALLTNAKLEPKLNEKSWISKAFNSLF
jgi:outer membrane protein assembly factor BamD